MADNRLVVAHDPEVAARRASARDKTIAELLTMGQQYSDKLDWQDESQCYLELLDGKLLPVTNTTAPALDVVQLKRIHQQTVQTTDGRTLSGLTEMAPSQKSLFAALELALLTPENLTKSAL